MFEFNDNYFICCFLISRIPVVIHIFAFYSLSEYHIFNIWLLINDSLFYCNSLKIIDVSNGLFLDMNITFKLCQFLFKVFDLLINILISVLFLSIFVNNVCNVLFVTFVIVVIVWVDFLNFIDFEIVVLGCFGRLNMVF